MKFTLDFISQSVRGKIISQPHRDFKTYCVDNRSENIQDSLFIPLAGDNYDAHSFVAKAVEAGATGVLFSKWDDQWESLKDKATFIEVDDTLKALQNLGRQWRKTLPAKVLALTGSNGKTTTKDFLNQLLSHFGRTNASKGSFNNHWGVPFTLLDTDLDHKFCVVEMGMNHAGEIITLNNIAEPDLVMVTNVGRAHMGHFEDGIKGVARAKEEIYESAPATSQLLFNIDNEWTRQMYAKYADRPSYTFSNHNFSADVYLKIKSKVAKGYEIEGQIGGVIGKAQVNFWGEHNLQNLAAAVCMAYIGGARPDELWPLLEKCHTGWGRNQWVDTSLGAQILFDGYNANPDSFEQLLNNVGESWNDQKNYVAFFGEMLELGDEANRQHRELGRKAAALNWEHCLFIGPSGPAFREGWEEVGNKNTPMILSTYKDSLDLDLKTMVNDQSLVFVKGSRGGALERIVERLDPINFSPKK